MRPPQTSPGAVNAIGLPAVYANGFSISNNLHPMTGARVLFYVQSLLGIGHLRRAAAIARALRGEGLNVYFVSGGEPVPNLDLGGATYVQLPPARASDAAFTHILDDQGRKIDEAWRIRRRDLLLSAFAQIEPRIVLVELFPFGRRPFRFELIPLLDSAIARRPRPAVLCSVRDVLIGKNDPRRLAETADTVRRYFDLVLVHGDPRLIRFDETFQGANLIADRLRYTGYVVSHPPPGSALAVGGQEVLVSAGGGAVGEPLLRAALAARPLTTLAACPWRLITGFNLSERVFGELLAAASSGVCVERFRSDFQTLLRGCRLSVSQAGYNTVMEIVSLGTRAVAVPFADGQESEQTLRARLLAERGLLRVVEPASLSARELATAIDAVAQAPPPSRPSIDLTGATKTARIVAALASQTSGDTLSDGGARPTGGTDTFQC
jgi:predicted glycosyltransferase